MKVWLAITKAGHKKGTMSYVQLLETFKGQESDHTKQIEKVNIENNRQKKSKQFLK